MSLSTSLVAARNAVTSKAGRQVLLTQKHSPTILFVGGVVGVVGTVVLASKATLKLDEIMTEKERKHEKAAELLADPLEDYSARDYTKDSAALRVKFVGDVAKLYAPAVGLGLISIGALTGSHVVLNRRNTALMAAYATVDQSFKEYRQRVIEKYGKDIDEELRFTDKLVEVTEQDDDGNDVKKMRAITGYSDYARFFDQMCKDWQGTPELNHFFLRAQQAYANDMLRIRGHVFLNEIYDNLDIPRTKAGAMVGWVKDGGGDNYIDFGFMDGDNPRARDFINGREGAILLDFNVDGVILDKI